MKYIIITLIILFPLVADSQLNMKESIKQGQANSIFYYEAIRDAEVAQSQYNFYKTQLRPQVSLDITAPNFFKTSREITQPNGSIRFQPVSQNSASFTLSAFQEIPSTGGRFFVTSDLKRFDDFELDQSLYNGIPFRIGFQQPLFSFNQLKYDKLLEPIRLETSKKKYVIDLESINLNTVDLYFNLLLAQENLSIAGKNRDINDKLLKIAEERFRLGKISENDRLQLQLELKSATKDYARAQNNLRSDYFNLTTFLKTESNQIIPAAIIPEPYDALNITEQRAIEEGRKNRPELLEYHQEMIGADMEIDRAKKNYGVQADLFASFGYARGSEVLSDIYTNPQTEQQVRLTVSIPILDWGRKKEATAIAQARKTYIGQRQEQNLLDFDNEIRKAVFLFKQLQSEIIAQKDIADVTDQRYNISSERYILGDISTTDLTIAQREKDQARRNYVAILREYWITYYQLRRLTGFDFLNNINIQYN